MCLTKRWSLKDKEGNEPSTVDRNCIEKLPRKDLFPCSRNINELEMPEKTTAPREMNSFIVFRRQLAYVAKSVNLSDDGKNLSRFASYIWHGATVDEKKGYAIIAKELKERHKVRYPGYTYERRKRRTSDGDFILSTPDTLGKEKKSKRRKANKALPVLPVNMESSLPAQEQMQHESIISPLAPIEFVSPPMQDFWTYSLFSQYDVINYGIDCDYGSMNSQVPQQNEWYADITNGDQSAGFYSHLEPLSFDFPKFDDHT
ncbi:11149_t:CDS:1 [Funneliformis mosseae]|uniref:11149_t:CDS:1 n=1 Tax=Funneliformis mosseae TaxID=27381 RepID=A0A9N8V3K8_FUNMO|nr:11149_t:CDS:1 [Funneliformis mosseae]